MSKDMILDVLLPSVLFLVAVIIVFLYSRFEKKLTSLFGALELRLGHVVLLVAAIAMIVTLMVFAPEVAMMVFFLFAHSTILFLFTYLIVSRWYMATPIPVLFVALYFSPYWNIHLSNFFAIIFAVCISVYVGSLFRWKTTVGFASLLTIVDVIQVVVTRFTVVSAERALELELPIGIILPAFPHPGWTFLGLGDLFLLGLLSIQTTRKYGRRFGLTSIISVTVVFLLLQTVLLNSGVRNLPATVLVISGWLIALGGRYLYKSCTLEDVSMVKALDEERLQKQHEKCANAQIQFALKREEDGRVFTTFK